MAFPALFSLMDVEQSQREVVDVGELAVLEPGHA